MIDGGRRWSAARSVRCAFSGATFDVNHGYDHRQMTALIVRCVRCRRWTYITQPAPLVCAVCRGFFVREGQ